MVLARYNHPTDGSLTMRKVAAVVAIALTMFTAGCATTTLSGGVPVPNSIL
jgi:hypothetical protein